MTLASAGSQPPQDQPGADSGRHAAGAARSWDLTVVLALLVPLLTAAAAFGIRTPTLSVPDREPELAALDRSDRGCPASPGGRVLVANPVSGARGEVDLLALDAGAPAVSLPVAADAVARRRNGDPLLVTGREAFAPGLLALRVARGTLAATSCPAPRPEVWFTGLGARAEHVSVLELVNPDVGAAVVDIDVWSKRGPLEVADLRGLRVPGRTTLTIDLAATVPRRTDLAARLGVSRGRIIATALDRSDPLGESAVAEEWLPSQREPATQTQLLGLSAGDGPRTLTVANPGSDEALVTLKVIAPESVFAPAEIQEVQVAPGALVSVRLDEVLGRETREGAVGIQLESTRPVTSSLSSLVRGDLALTGPATTVADEATALLPGGRSSVVLAGAAGAGLAVVVSRDDQGRRLDEQRIELTPGRAFVAELPRRAALVQITVQRTTVSAALLATGRAAGGGRAREGTVVVPLEIPERFGLVPDVAPAGR